MGSLSDCDLDVCLKPVFSVIAVDLHCEGSVALADPVIDGMPSLAGERRRRVSPRAEPGRLRVPWCRVGGQSLPLAAGSAEVLNDAFSTQYNGVFRRVFYIIKKI